MARKIILDCDPGHDDAMAILVAHGNPEIELIAITTVAAHLAAIIGGILVFGESIGSGGLGVTARVLAFCLVVAGAALMPAPLRAASAAPRPAPDPVS